MKGQPQRKKRRAGPPQRHVPERTCVACRQEAAKRELIRIVRTPEGRGAVDPTGKRAGRGGYLCRARSCWELALNRKVLDHALKTTVGPEDLAVLTEFARALPPNE